MDIIFVFLCSRVNPLYIIFFGLFGFAYGCIQSGEGHRNVFWSGGDESSEADWGGGHDRPSTSPSSRLLLCKGWWLRASQFVRPADTGCKLAQIIFRGPYFWERPGTPPWHIWSLVFPRILKGDSYFLFPGGKSMIQRNIKFCVQSHTASVTGSWMESFHFMIVWPAPQSCGL